MCGALQQHSGENWEPTIDLFTRQCNYALRAFKHENRMSKYERKLIVIFSFLFRCMTTIRQPWEWWRWNIVIDDNRSFCIHNWSAIPCLYSSASCTLDRDSGVREMRSGGVEWRNYDFTRTSNHKTVLDSCDFMVKTTFLSVPTQCQVRHITLDQQQQRLLGLYEFIWYTWNSLYVHSPSNSTL